MSRVEFGLFADWAGDNVRRWEKLRGSLIYDRVFGTGTVALVVYDSSLKDLVLRVKFPSGLRQYLSLGKRFGPTFAWVELDSKVAEEVLEGRVEQRDRLVGIRAVIASGELPGLRDLQWLVQNDHREELVQCEGILLKKHGPDKPAKIASELRGWGLPRRAIDFTNFIEKAMARNQSDSPVWTSRAAAFADLWDLDNAKRCAETALECNPKNSFAHNVLGRVYYQLGERDKAEQHFRIAEQIEGRAWGDRKALQIRREAQHGAPVDDNVGD